MSSSRLQEQARGIFTAGMNVGLSILNTVTRSGNDSSDDGEIDNYEDEAFIKNGTRGIIVYTSLSIRTGKKKMVHLNLYKNTITQYHDSGKKKKSISCSDIINISNYTDRIIYVEYKGAMEVQTHTKRFMFENELTTINFINQINLLHEFGKILKYSFNQIDISKTGRIDRDNLRIALNKVDLNDISEDSITKMLDYGTSGYDYIDFFNFFHIFINSYVANLRDCLLEWYILATEDSSSLTVPLSNKRLKIISEIYSLKLLENLKNVKLLPGEILKFITTDRLYFAVFVGKYSKQPYCQPGIVVTTNFRIVLVSTRKQFNNNNEFHTHNRYQQPAFFDTISIPLTTVNKMSISSPRNSLYIHCKDYKTVRITICRFEGNKSKVEAIMNSIYMNHSIKFNLDTNQSRSNSPTNGTISPPPPPPPSQLSPSSRHGVSLTQAQIQQQLLQQQQQLLSAQDSHYTANSNNSNFYNISPSASTSSNVFAFQFCPKFPITENSWNLTDIIKEYFRQGIFNAPEWKIFKNIDYSISDTYPPYIVLPSQLSLEQVKLASQFRSRNRLPCVTYLHKFSNAVITRSAQPLVGLTQKNSIEDENLLNLIRMKGIEAPPKSPKFLNSKLYIVDARGKIAATLNMAVGKGTEDTSQYQNTELVFCNIDNIHVMRSSASILAENLTTNYNHYTNYKDIMQSSEGTSAGYYTKLEDSGWLRYSRLILLSSCFIAEKIHFDGDSVLVHCSDGWDRTSQLCAVAQLLLDPYFRTIEGFAVLVEKDWCSFGHKFADRIGQKIIDDVNINNTSEERSPVFLQFLDVVFQVMVQFPRFFQFNEDFLIFLADHSYSCLFGNFLGNSHKERHEELKVNERTLSIWDYIFSYKENFTNPNFSPCSTPIWPSTSISSMKVWKRFWLRWDISSHPLDETEGVIKDDFGEKVSSYSFYQALIEN